MDSAESMLKVVEAATPTEDADRNDRPYLRGSRKQTLAFLCALRAEAHGCADDQRDNAGERQAYDALGAACTELIRRI